MKFATFHRKSLATLLGIVAIVVCSQAPVLAAEPSVVLPQKAIDQIMAIVAAKATRTPTQKKIDSRLLQELLESRGQQIAPGLALEPAHVKRTTGDLLLVDITAQSPAAVAGLVAKLKARGGVIVHASPEYATVRAEVALQDTELIAGFEEVTFIQPAVEALTNGIGLSQKARLPFIARAAIVRDRLAAAFAAMHPKPVPFTGSVNSQGDRTHRADDVRATFSSRGAGIRIGVLSDSYNANGGASTDIASGDLPGTGNPLGHTTPVTVLDDDSTGTDEGRAMLQIVHDLAPDAQLFFATADFGASNFASNITALRNSPNRCDIIIDDVFYYDEPAFQDGVVAQAVNGVTASGALYFSSAGNQGSIAKGTASVYEGDFNSNGSPAFSFPGGAKAGTVHNFGTVATPIIGDTLLSTGSTGKKYVLMWSDPQGGSSNDYDLFLVSSSGTVKSQSTTVQSGTQSPFELIQPPTLVSGDRLVVFKSSSAAVRAFALNAFGGQLSVATTGQTHGHSSSVDAYSVGAASAAAVYPSAFSTTSQIETFSSDGPRRIFLNPDGTQITPGNVLFGTSGGTVRNKPDISAADAVSTTVGGFSTFYGTSAAAPHAGAVAALLKSANPSLTPAQIRSILTSTAVDVESAGYDNISGSGILQAYQAMQAVPSGGSCGTTGLQTIPASTNSAPGKSASAGLQDVPAIANLPKGGVWTRTPKPNGEVWTYKFTIGDATVGGDSSSGTSAMQPPAALPANDGSAAAGLLDQAVPLPGLIMQRRFATDADPVTPNTRDANRLYDVKFDAATAALPPELVALSGDKSGWVSVHLDQTQLALVRASSLPYRCVRQNALPGLDSLTTATSSITGSVPIIARAGSPIEIAAKNETSRGLTILTADFASHDAATRISSARVRLALKARYLDHETIWLSAGSRKIVLWDGWGGTDNGLFDDSGKLQDSIAIDRVLTDEIEGDTIAPWTLNIANADPSNAAQLQEFWIALTVTTPGGKPANHAVTLATMDFAAQRAYLETAPSNGGTEVSQPTVGQLVYFYGDYSVNGSGSTVSISNRLLLDGSVFCFGTFSVTPGLSYWFGCNSGWTATSGSHTLQLDVDYTNAVLETNESNNSAVKSITTSGLDFVAQRSYLRTASNGGGSEVSQPATGQTVYFYGDYTVNGTGSSVSISNRLLLDGSVYCFGTFNVTPSSSYWFGCNSGWTATSGSHTLRFDVDYTNVVAETNENNNSASSIITPAGLDFVAQRAYLRTASNGGGSEVSQPALGQAVYFYGDYTVSGSGNSVSISNRLLFDGSLFCFGTFSVTPGSSYWFGCNSGWTATSGSHSLQFDVDYTNAVAETNEGNNSSSTTITPTGVDVVAQRAYLKTAASNGGTEVTQPTVGQTVYFYGDYTLNGSGSAVSISNRALLDGSLFCFGTFSESPGSSYWFGCNSGWTVTSGTHTLQVDFDYTNTIAEPNENNNSVSTAINAAGGLDVVAQRAYMRSAASGSGVEVNPPAVGQTVYFHADYQVTGGGGGVNVTQRAMLDGTAFCSCSSLSNPGSSYTSSCSQSWTATSGSHSLQWDFDYTNAITETNETNNSASTTFTPLTGQSLSIARNGTGSGTVISSPSGINCGGTCTATFTYNTVVALSATAANGSVFAGWTGEGCSGTGTCQVTMSQTRNLTATFNTSDAVLTVSLSGTGNGSVSTSPAGISCPTSCSASFALNTTVTLSALPSLNMTFAGWSGDCTGQTCQVVMSQSRNVTAIFNSSAPRIVRVDIDADRKTDVSIFRPLAGDWFLRRSSNAQTVYIPNWGPQASDIPVPGDYDGDGIVDAAVFRPGEGNWYIRRSTDGTLLLISQWGLGANDKPVAADYDGDGKTDAAIFRPGTGEWFIRQSSTGQLFYVPNFGPASGDIPVPGDYDGDGKADIAIFRPIAGDWFIRRSIDGATSYIPNFGPQQNDKPVPADYDGDGKTDIAIFRPLAGDWFIRRSSTGTVSYIPNFGPQSTDIPVPGDYDGDGKADIAIFRPIAGNWYVLQSSSGTVMLVTNYGPQSGDKPLPAYQY